ncbi:MAG TPA: DinB family protein [Flavisolibacter sp.]|jgi:uncharacterized damage-inducible protein DinB|nr:DinB family protein [Flavisolibacter sp.]
MEKQFEIIRKTRQFLLNIISDLSAEQLNQVPTGFNNNIIWNVGHIIAAQQGVCYRRSGLPLLIQDSFFEQFKPETKPQGTIDATEIQAIKDLLFSTLDQLEADYKAGGFKNYISWTNRYGVTHDTIEDTINFLLFHEGLHMGYVMALKRCVQK